MKNKKTAIMALVLAMSVIMLTGCGTSKYVGEWHIVSGNNNGTEMDIEKLEELTGGPLVMILEKDGTVKLGTADETTAESKWKKSDDGILVYEEDKEKDGLEYILKDGQLVCNVGGMEMFLEKQ